MQIVGTHTTPSASGSSPLMSRVHRFKFPRPNVLMGPVKLSASVMTAATRACWAAVSKVTRMLSTLGLLGATVAAATAALSDAAMGSGFSQLGKWPLSQPKSKKLLISTMEVLRSERGSSKGRLRVTQGGDEAGARLAGARQSVRGGCVQLGMVSRGMVVASEVEVAMMIARVGGEMAVVQLYSGTSRLM